MSPSPTSSPILNFSTKSPSHTMATTLATPSTSSPHQRCQAIICSRFPSESTYNFLQNHQGAVRLTFQKAASASDVDPAKVFIGNDWGVVNLFGGFLFQQDGIARMFPSIKGTGMAQREEAKVEAIVQLNARLQPLEETCVKCSKEIKILQWQPYQRHSFTELMPGGVNSHVRAFKSVGGQPIVFDFVKGSHMSDVDGNEYIYYVGSWGPAIIGHADDKLSSVTTLLLLRLQQ